MSIVTTSPPSIIQLNTVYACSPYSYSTRTPTHSSALPRPHKAISNTVAAPSPSAQLAELRAFERLLGQLYDRKDLQLGSAARLDSARQSAWLLVEKNHGYRFLVKYAASTPVKLLRCERHSLETESLVLDLLRINGVYGLIPTRISHCDDKRHVLGQPYIIRSYVAGVSASTVLSEFTNSSLKSSIDASLGAHLRSVTSIIQRRFGSAHRVLGGSGSKTWAEAFFAMLEAVLRDGEDHLIALPYDSIRFWTAASAPMLADIKIAQLVPMALGEYNNVLLDEPTRSGVVGLLGWDDVVFGDPFISGVFLGKDAAFWNAYAAGDGAMIAPCEGRQILYTVYRSLITIVKCHLRPRDPNVAFAARRDLNVALNRLAGQV